MASVEELQIWQLGLTGVLGVATLLIYGALLRSQKKQAKASQDLATLAAGQHEMNQAKLHVVAPGKYPFTPDSKQNLATHPRIPVELANTGWKDSDLLASKVLLIPAKRRATSGGFPHCEIYRSGENRTDLHLPAGRRARFDLVLEPQHLPDPFYFGDYHVAYQVTPVNGSPSTHVIRNPSAELECPEDWQRQLEFGASRPHP